MIPLPDHFKRRAALLLFVVLLLAGLRVYRGMLVRVIEERRRGIAADYVFDGNRTAHAVFFAGKEPRAELTLGDGRKLRLRQAPAASGARYAAPDGSIVFWIKGNSAFLEENGKATYVNGKQVPQGTAGTK